MNAKRSLKNRIRGWFPQEPTLKKPLQFQGGRVKVESDIKPQSIVIPPGYNVSATKTAGLQSIYFTVLGFFFVYIFSFLTPDFSFSLTYMVAWVIAGLTVGAISGGMYTKNQLKRLSKNQQIYPNIKDMILLCVPMLTLFFVGIYSMWFLYGAYMQGSALLVLLASVFALGISAQTTMYALFASFEKRKNMCLMRMAVGWRIIAIPKPPSGNLNRSEIPANNV